MFALTTLLRHGRTYLAAGAILAAIGVAIFTTAHAASPVKIDGAISDYIEYTRNGAYDRNELKLANDSSTYTLTKTSFHPALPDSVYRDGRVSIWVDRGSSTIVAITLYDANDENPVKYTTERFDTPSTQLSSPRTLGIVIAIVGATMTAATGLSSLIRRARRRAAPKVDQAA